MTINELMLYYLENSEVANGGTSTGQSGISSPICVKIKSHEGYTEQIEARVWGEIRSEPTVLLKLYYERYYALSHETYREICNLLTRDLSNCETFIGKTLGGYPGGVIDVSFPGGITIKAKAWYEIPPGEVIVFQVDNQIYAISRNATKTTSHRIISQRRTGNFANPDPRREIIWYPFNLSGHGIPGFPQKPAYLI